MILCVSFVSLLFVCLYFVLFVLVCFFVVYDLSVYQLLFDMKTARNVFPQYPRGNKKVKQIINKAPTFRNSKIQHNR